VFVRDLTVTAVANPLKLMRLAVALLALTTVAVLLSPLSTGAFLPENVVARGLVFYGLTSGGYCILPLVRRGDIAAVAMWVVLGVGIAPCVMGEEISAAHMFADMGGVILAAAPIYIARFRQVIQGDTRHPGRRQGDA
jgi:hypothetical protein